MIRSLVTWAKPAYQRVSETILEDGTRTSTIWLGLDHNLFGSGPPLIFESMVFAGEVSHSPGTKAKDGWPGLAPYDCHEDWDQQRYSTEAEAIAVDDALVRKWKGIRERWKKAGVVENVREYNKGNEYLN